MKRALLVLVAAVAGLAALGLSACTPTSGRYIDLVFASTTKSTHLYKETKDLTTGADLDLFTDVYQPTGDTLAKRPAIVWVHGGGFKTGNRTQIGDVAAEWARRGYVTLSISYRLDPGNKCQEYQDGKFTDPVQAEAERARCERAIYAAQNDAFSALGWLRRHAAEFKVDTSRLVVAGSSAGAVTALNVAQRGNVDGGAVPVGRSVKAALAMSGCQYDPAAIDANDAPIAMIASGGDISVPYECSVATVDAAKGFGTPVAANYWPDESYHAKDLYRRHQAEIDAGWTSFLYQRLALTQP
ncbi:MAG: alpha/beta hydrolase [Acidimicrobiales bacterium]